MVLAELCPSKWLDSIVEISQKAHDRTEKFFRYRAKVVRVSKTKVEIEINSQASYVINRKWMSPGKLEVIQHG